MVNVSALIRRAGCAAAAALVTSLGTFAAPAGAAPKDFATACPEITDSVYRLYSAYFLREPDERGFSYWLDTYSSGANLSAISNSFAEQLEFELTYGDVDDAQFVDLLYNNVFDREPDASGRAFWIDALAAGLTRGELMISFSESEEFVLKTGTTEPLAGLGMWYPPGTKWACDSGTWDWSTDLAGADYLDIFLANTNTASSNFTLDALNLDGSPMQNLQSDDVEGSFYLFYWNFDVSDLSPTGALRVTAPAGAYTAIVSFPHPHSGDRPGWGD